MSDATVRGQTQAILEHYEMRRDEIIDDDSGSLSPEQFSLLDAAARDAIRLLRENKTNYVRMEEASVARILGNPDLRQGIDVGYTAAKAEIDHAIGQVLAEKTKHRNMVRPPATAPPSTEDEVQFASVAPWSVCTTASSREFGIRTLQTPIVGSRIVGVLGHSEREVPGAGNVYAGPSIAYCENTYAL